MNLVEWTGFEYGKVRGHRWRKTSFIHHMNLHEVIAVNKTEIQALMDLMFWLGEAENKQHK